MVALVAGALASGVVLCKDDADTLAIGQRIYREGVLPSGRPLQGVGQARVTLTGKDAACTTCHRRSGYGSSEGPIEVRAITGPALFGERVAPYAPGSPQPAAGGFGPAVAPNGASAAEAARANAGLLRAARTAQFAGSRPRPAYDDAALARAIREGVDVTGRAMSASMPRYTLDSAAIESLTGYLKALSAQSSPGVTEDAVHFATVIQPGTDSAQRRALVEVLQTFFRDRNLGQRTEIRREQAGMVRLHRTYREWVLHVWELTGPAETWPAQLEARQQARPVFALVSGLGHASWRPIHEFSERFEVPCIFPQVDQPVITEGDFYTVYLSQGLTLEGQSLAKFLQDSADRGPVTQVFRRGTAGAAGAEAFRKAWATSGGGGVPLIEHALETPPDAAFWQGLARQSPGATLVLWLPPQDLPQAPALVGDDSRVKAVYLSSSLAGDRRSGLSADGGGRVRLVYPQELPASREARLEVVRRWLRNNGLTLSDERVQMNAYLAATVTGMVLAHSRDAYSRELLLERLEHRVGTAHELSIFPHLSLGPGQRYASKGSYIVRVDGEGEQQLTPVSGWIVP